MKFLNVVRSMYGGTSARICVEGEISEPFDTGVGVRQGCVMSPLLFALFLNDLHDSLSGGVNVKGKNIRILMYADDIVITAESAEDLQVMMDELAAYCRMWDLEVNLDKSEVMIMKKGGGKIKDMEKWVFDGNVVRVTKKYRYLGVSLVPSLRWNEHLAQRMNDAKMNVNMVWNMYVGKREVKFVDKMRLFNAVCRSIVCYACQVWGASSYNEVEKIKKWFVKKVLGLPKGTPDYVVCLETGAVPIHLYTMKCQMKYMRKVLFEMNDSRLVKYLAGCMLSEGIGWVEEWERICGRHGIVIGRDMRLDEYDKVTGIMMETEYEWLMHENNEKARNGKRHGCYNELRYDVSGMYWEREMSVRKIGTIIRVRGGLLGLNANVWRMGERRKCSLCNMGEEESVLHFLCICPILGDVRMRFFRERRMSRERGIRLLNGEDWDCLFEYVCMAMKERAYMIEMFNF